MTTQTPAVEWGDWDQTPIGDPCPGPMTSDGDAVYTTTTAAGAP